MTHRLRRGSSGFGGSTVGISRAGSSSVLLSAAGRNGRRVQPRVFRCATIDGAFKVNEVLDYCQDDLAKEDVLIVDPGSAQMPDVYVWVGQSASASEVLLAERAAQVYVENSGGERVVKASVVRMNGGGETEFFKCTNEGGEGEGKRRKEREEK